jgi:hypothetical protein
VKTQQIVIDFPFPVEMPGGFFHTLDCLLAMATKQYERENPDRTMWPFMHGGDDATYVIRIEEREALPRELERRKRQKEADDQS